MRYLAAQFAFVGRIFIKLPVLSIDNQCVTTVNASGMAGLVEQQSMTFANGIICSKDVLKFSSILPKFVNCNVADFFNMLVDEHGVDMQLIGNQALTLMEHVDWLNMHVIAATKLRKLCI